MAFFHYMMVPARLASNVTLHDSSRLVNVTKSIPNISNVSELTRHEQQFGCNRLRILPAFSWQNHLYPAFLGLDVFLASHCNTSIYICILYNRCTLSNNGAVNEIKQPIHGANFTLLPPEFQ